MPDRHDPRNAPRRPPRTALLAAALALLLAPSAAGALEAELVFGVGGAFRRDTPIPVELRLRNRSPRPFAGEALVAPNDSPAALRRVNLPPDSEARVVLPFLFSPATHLVRLRIDDAAGYPVFEESFSVNQASHVPPERALLVALDAGGARIPGSGRSGSLCVSGGSELVPDHPEGLVGASAVLVGDIDPGAFSDAQLSALRRHAESGGRLALSPAAGAALLAHPVFAGLVDGRFGAPEPAERIVVPGDFTGSTVDRTPRTIIPAAPVPRAPLPAAPRALPLSTDALAVPLGAGHLILLTFPPFDRGLLDHPEYGPALERLLAAPRRPTLEPVKHINDSRLLPDSVRRAEPAPIFFFLFLYIVVVGPANYLYLATRKRKDLLLVTIPALALAAGAVLYLIIEVGREETSLLRQVDVVRHAGAGMPARAVSVASRFSSGNERFTVSLPPGAAVCPYSPSSYTRTRYAEMLEGAVARHRDDGVAFGPVRVERWSGAIFHMAVTVPSPAAPAVPDGALIVSVRRESQPGKPDDVRLDAVGGKLTAGGAPALATWLIVPGLRTQLALRPLPGGDGNGRTLIPGGGNDLPAWANDLAGELLSHLESESTDERPLLVFATGEPAFPVTLSSGGPVERVAFHVFRPEIAAGRPRTGRELFTEGEEDE